MSEIYSEWNGFKSIEFEFEKRKAIIVFPKSACEGKKWLLKTEYFGAFPNLEITMLERGYHLAYIANIPRWMVPDDIDVKARFAEFLIEKYSLNRKCVPVGMSCGGLHAVYFAAKYPEYISSLYLDAPVMNLLSTPMAIGRVRDSNNMIKEFFDATGITLSELLNYRNHPIDNAPAILAANIPIVLVSGDSDTIVPYHENGYYLSEFYKNGGGEILEIIKPGGDHHPHGLEDNTPIIDFIEKHYSIE